MGIDILHVLHNSVTSNVGVVIDLYIILNIQWSAAAAVYLGLSGVSTV